MSSKVLHSLLNKIWNEEDIPQDWKVGLLVKIPKKGDLCLCKNWRSIMLLTVAIKVVCKITFERMRDALKGRLQDEQAGFRSGEIMLRPDRYIEDHSAADHGVEHWAIHGLRRL